MATYFVDLDNSYTGTGHFGSSSDPLSYEDFVAASKTGHTFLCKGTRVLSSNFSDYASTSWNMWAWDISTHGPWRVYGGSSYYFNTTANYQDGINYNLRVYCKGGAKRMFFYGMASSGNHVATQGPTFEDCVILFNGNKLSVSGSATFINSIIYHIGFGEDITILGGASGVFTNCVTQTANETAFLQNFGTYTITGMTYNWTPPGAIPAYDTATLTDFALVGTPDVSSQGVGIAGSWASGSPTPPSTKVAEYNFNNWIIPTPPVTPTTPEPPYYPDLSGNGYNLDDNRGNSMAAGDGPAGDSAGNCVNLTNLNTYFGANSTIANPIFEWNTGGAFSIFWCMRIMVIPPTARGFYPVVTNYANTYPFWNVYVNFSGAHNEDNAKITLAYEEVGATGVLIYLASQRMTVDYLWHTFAVTVDRDNGIAKFYWDAVEQVEQTWNTALNTNIKAQQHEIVFFGTNLRPDFGHLTNNPPVNLRFDGTEFYRSALDLSDIQTLHAKYT